MHHMAALPLALGLMVARPDIQIDVSKDGIARIDKGPALTRLELRSELHRLAAAHGGCLHVKIVGQPGAYKQATDVFIATLEYRCPPTKPPN